MPDELFDTGKGEPVVDATTQAGQITPSSSPTEPEAPPPAAPPSLVEQLKSKGLDVTGISSDNDAVELLVNSHRQAQELPKLQQLAYWGQQYQAVQPEFEVWRKKQQADEQAKQSAQQAETKKKLWGGPEYDPAWDAHVKYDPESGRYIGLNQWVPPNIVQGVNARKEWERDSLRKLVNDPFTLMQEGLGDWVKEQAQAVVQAQFEQYQQQQMSQAVSQYTGEIVASHSPWLHQRDSHGNIVYGPQRQDGYRIPLLTEEGKQYAEAVKLLEASGVSDPESQDRLALKLIGHTDKEPAKPAGVTTDPNTPETRRARFVDVAGKGAAKKSASPDNPEDFTEDASFFEIAQKQALKRGITI